jgi:RNA polymerase sigma-70 factor, ECF subfamily
MAFKKNTDPYQKFEIRESLMQSLDKLSKGQREVLGLNAVEGFSGEEIARILGIRPKTVWTRLHRARAQMVKTMARQEASRPLLRASA